MKGRVVAIWLSLILIFGGFVVLDISWDLTPSVRGATHYVNTTGVGAYTSIQAAINDSIDGETVFVYSGTYYENVIVNRSISLIGEDKNTTIIQGDNSTDVVAVTSDWVNVTGFTVTGAGFEVTDAGIELFDVSNCKIQSNIAPYNGNGISLWVSHNNTISGNEVSFSNYSGINVGIANYNIITYNFGIYNYYGVNLDASIGCNVSGCNFSYNDDGIYLSSSNNNSLTDNDLSYNQYGIALYSSTGNHISDNNVIDNDNRGIYVESSDMNYVMNNNASNNNNYGILIMNSIKNEVMENTLLDNSNGIVIDTSHETIVANNTVELNGWCGIGIFDSSNNDIMNNTISDQDKGVYLYGASSNTISNNTIFNNYEGIFYYFSGSNYAANNDILNNNYGIYIRYSTNEILRNNNITEYGFFVYGEALEQYIHDIDTTNTVNYKPLYYWISQNGSSVPSDAGQIILVNCTNIDVANQSISKTYVGILLVYSSNISISHCNISFNDLYGIDLDYSSYITIENNTLYGNYYGICIPGNSEYNEVSYNNITSNSSAIWMRGAKCNFSYNFISDSRYGFDIDSSDDSLYQNNTIISSSNNGFDLSYSDNNIIINNTISDNSYGIRTYQSHYNIILNNNIVNNTNYGAYISSSSWNTICHNNFYNNTVQAWDSRTTNDWNYDYANGGNFWDDYQGIDEKFGPDQDIPGSDGMGDTPYDDIIASNNKDRYPLMSAFESWEPPEDDIPPVISNVRVNDIKETEVTIIWTTNEYCTGTLNYSENPDLSNKSTHYHPNYYVNHSFFLWDLTPNQTYYFEVMSVDAFGNPTSDNNGTMYFHFTTLPLDLEPPTIWDVQQSPLFPEVYDEVSIYANISDNVEVDHVSIKIRDPRNRYHGNYTMNYLAVNDTYYYAMEYPLLGNYTYEIWANDLSGNYISANGTVPVQDFTAPTITILEVSPEYPMIGNYIEITVYIFDNLWVEGRYLNITYPDGTTTYQYSMSHPDTNIYNTEIYMTIPGNYSCVVVAWDSSYNLNQSEEFVITIYKDEEPPEITDRTTSVPGNIQSFFAIQASVTDNVAIDDVWAVVEFPESGEVQNFTMSKSISSGYYRISRRYAEIGQYNYTIWADDYTGNIASETGSFTIIDTQDPTADCNLRTRQNTFNQGSTVFFDGSRSRDNHRVENYTWTFVYDGETLIFYGVSQSFTFITPGEYVIELRVRDPSGNEDTRTDSLTIRRLDSDHDGLSNYDEVNIYGTDPNKRDTDGDGVDDGTEVENGDDPLNPEIRFWWLLLIEAAIAVLLILFGVKVFKKQKDRAKEAEEAEEESEDESEDEPVEGTSPPEGNYPPPPPPPERYI